MDRLGRGMMRRACWWGLLASMLLPLSAQAAATDVGLRDRGGSRLCWVAKEGDQAVEARRSETVETSDTRSCRTRPTTRVELLVNLDSEHRPASGEVPDLSSVPTYSERIEVRGLDGQPRALRLLWRPELGRGAWRFEVRPVEESSDSPDRDGVAAKATHPGSTGMLRFDEHGGLLEPSEVEIALPPETGREQKIVFSFEKGRSASSSFAYPFVLLAFEHDGEVCEHSAELAEACVLAPGFRYRRFVGPVETMEFSADGQYLSTERQRVQGYQLDLASGEHETVVSDAHVPIALTPPRATTRVRLAFELDVRAPIETMPTEIAAPFGAPADSLEFDYYDRLGVSRTARIELLRIAFDRWAWQSGADRLRSHALWRRLGGGSLDAFDALVDRGELLFDERGLLTAVTQGGRVLGPGEWATIRPGQSVFLAAEDGDRTDHGIGVDFGLLHTRMSLARRDLLIEQDGYGAGQISSVRISPDLTLVGQSSSGVAYPLSRLAISEALDFAIGTRPGEDDTEDPRGSVCRFACSNGIDDDGDGGTDFGPPFAIRSAEDPGCSESLDGSERTAAFQCDDGLDNDGDGRIDYPMDPGCLDSRDQDESPADLEIRVVRRRRAGWKQPGEIVVAVLDRGGVPLSFLDATSLRLDLGSRTSRRTSAEEMAGGHPRKRPDADCDGRADRLFRFELPAGVAGDEPVCLSGVFDEGTGEGVDFPDLARSSEPSRRVAHERFDFRVCAEGGWNSTAKSRSGPPLREPSRPGRARRLR